MISPSCSVKDTLEKLLRRARPCASITGTAVAPLVGLPGSTMMELSSDHVLVERLHGCVFSRSLEDDLAVPHDINAV